MAPPPKNAAITLARGLGYARSTRPGSSRESGRAVAVTSVACAGAVDSLKDRSGHLIRS